MLSLLSVFSLLILSLSALKNRYMKRRIAIKAIRIIIIIPQPMPVSVLIYGYSKGIPIWGTSEPKVKGFSSYGTVALGCSITYGIIPGNGRSRGLKLLISNSH